MSKAINIIQAIEKKWHTPLLEKCQSCFENTFIPSHNHHHHQRVWNYCKEIFLTLSSKKEITKDVAEAAIFSVFFHDTGMTIDPGPKHGKHSKDIFLEYIQQNNIALNNTCSITEIIAIHDYKEYQKSKSKNSIIDGIDLLELLNVCDDLDAFGETGIYRYTEIYLMRGISENELAAAIITNATQRFQHFAKGFKDFPELVKIHQDRYEILINFFNDLENSPTNQRIIHLIKSIIVEQKADMRKYLLENENETDEVKAFFFHDLSKQLYLT